MRGFILGFLTALCLAGVAACEHMGRVADAGAAAFCTFLTVEQRGAVEAWLDGQGDAVIGTINDTLESRLADAGLSPTTIALVRGMIGTFGLDHDLEAYCTPQDRGSDRLGPPGIEVVAAD